MSEKVPSEAPANATGRYQRSAKNYLLDPKFQLKYTGIIVVTALVLSVVLGLQLWQTSEEVIVQSKQALVQGQETVKRGQQLVTESKKVSEVVSMNIAKDPDYAADPELAKLFKEDSAARDRQLADEQKRLEHDAQLLVQQANYLALQQRKSMYVIFGGLSLLVIAIGFVGIVLTHRVAGPIHKMKGLLRQIGEGKLKIHSGLRKGDELQHFYDAFVLMVEALRKRDASEVARLDEVISSLDGSVATEKLATLRSLRRDIQTRLED